MKSSDNKAFIYEKCQLIETTCQLRFPTILSIDTKEPADFQETIRDRFPRYRCAVEHPPATAGKAAADVRNHSFVSADGTMKINLTREFIAFSTVRYTGWETFARMMDEPLGQFIRIYKPAGFSRIGLRYLNGFSRGALGLEHCRWNDLLQPQYLSVLDDDAVEEASVLRCSVDLERRLDSRCGVKIHAGPGSIRRTVKTEQGLQTVQEKEIRFILDLDVYATGETPLAAAAETMELLHDHADRLFSDAITDVLHDAMNPVEL